MPNASLKESSISSGRISNIAADPDLSRNLESGLMTAKKTSTPVPPLGEALVKEGVITRQQLSRALRIHRYLEQPKPFGALLVELGYATKKSIALTLSKHGATLKLGEILLEQGIITQETLQQALLLQKEHGVKLGHALIDLGAVSERVLLQSLAHQAGLPYIEPAFGLIDAATLQGVSPEYLARFTFIPFNRNENGKLTIVVPDMQDNKALDAISQLYHDDYTLAIGPPEQIRQAIEDFRRFRQQLPETLGHAESSENQENSVTQLVDNIIGAAIEERASDIHIEPMSEVIRLRYRIDGSLVYKSDLPKDLLPKIVSRIKIMAECNISEHQHHQGGRMMFTYLGREYDLRLSVYVTVHGESPVIRILNKQSALIDLNELGMSPTMLDRFRSEVLDQPTGVVLITGPTGSGKTTTLYSSLNYCNSVDTKIITAEDPVEYVVDGLVQCSMHEKIGRTFEATLREIVRQDPDIIVLGEIRDKASAQVAIQAALTGHKVYSTFHTEDTIGGLLRLIDMDIETFLISSTVISVVAQRLLRRICDHCAVPFTPPPALIDRAGLRLEEVRDYEFKKGNGCQHCSYTGYRGRVGVYELLVLNDEVKEAILQKRPSHIIRHTCTESTGLVSMREDAIAKTIRGFTTFDEVLKRTPSTFATRNLRQIMAMTQ